MKYLIAIHFLIKKNKANFIFNNNGNKNCLWISNIIGIKSFEDKILNSK